MASNYGAGNISILKGLAAVQQRPGMYVGDVSSASATHHLLYEIFDNSIDEVLAGHASSVRVTLHSDGSASVEDDGRGIPVEIHPEVGISAAEVVFTTLHAGGKFDGDSYRFSGGLHGVGGSCVNALSDWLELRIVRDGGVWSARFEEGATIKGVTRDRASKKSDGGGTIVRFKPSAKYLKVTEFERDTLLNRFREVAFLNGGVEIVFRDERRRPDETEDFVETCRFDDGMVDFVRHIIGEATLACPLARFTGEHDGVRVDAAFAWMAEDRPEEIRAYTNNIPQADGGQHVTGLRTGLTRALLAYAERNKLLKRSNRMGADDLREGLAAALHVHVPDPAFSSQTKEKLISTEARAAVEAVVGPAFGQWLDTHPEEARLIIQRAQMAAEAREAAKKARELSRTKKVGKRVSSASLPEKLADCASKNAIDRELFLVEGDSAGGSAKQGRDRETQAILPLRGKILNVERAKASQVLKNAEIAAMIQTLGAGVGDKMDLSRMRYGKVVVMTDADVDGSHIATLILTFFFRQMRPLVEDGRLYLAAPPLYRVRRKGEADIYVRSEHELTGLFLDRALSARALRADGSVLEGAGVRKALEGLIDASMNASAASRILRNPALADAILGDPDYRLLAGAGPVSATRWKKVCNRIGGVLRRTDPDATWALEIVGDETGYGLSATRTEDGLDVDYSLGRADLGAWQARRLADEFAASGLSQESLEVSSRPVYGPISFMEALRQAGQKGAQVSRYKGLGEMNPEELWETTMNPRDRTLRRVTIADAEAADTTFSDLMADNVAARRALIEEMCSGDRVLDF